ncbi:MAG: hypothetical protein JWQ38_2362 [Flavipsychrobacter sp.]|nr:hypothetical protein [Flavipsychrobacter sp.]
MSGKHKQRTQQPQQATVQSTAKTSSAFSLQWKLMILLAVISIAVYANSIGNGFVLDDSTAITSNKLVQKGLFGIPELLHTPYHWGYSVVANDLYRPLSLVLFATEYQMFGMEPAPGHLINVLLFAGCVLLLFLFLDRLFEQKKTAVAFISSLLFVLHPIHTEVVDNIKSADELLCFFFAFLSLNVFVRYARDGKVASLIIGSFCFFLALLSKETAITFLAVIPFVFFLYKNENRKRSIHILSCVVLGAVVFLCIRFSVLSAYHVNNLSEHFYMKNALAKPGLAFESRLATAVLMLGHYLRLLFIPYPLLCDYSIGTIPFVHFSDYRVLISLVAYLMTIWVAIRYTLQNNKGLYAFGAVFFLVTLSLFSNIFFLTGATMAERFLFFPSVGFCIVVAALLEQLAIRLSIPGSMILRKPQTLGVIIVLSICYTAVTINRNADWKNNFTLFSTDLNKAPDNSRLNFFVGHILLNTPGENDRKQEQDAVAQIIPYFLKTVAVCPDDGLAQLDLGTAYVVVERYDSAEKHLEKALETESGNIECIQQLGRTYFMTKKYQSSVDAYKKVNAMAPGNTFTVANLGLSHLYAGNSDSAIYYAQQALLLEPGFAGSFQILSHAYRAKNNIDSANKYEFIAQKNTPGYTL